MSLLFNMWSRVVITFLPRSKYLLILWLHSRPEVILEPQKIKSDTVSTVSPSVCHEVMGPDAMILVFWMLSLKPTFSLSSFTIKGLFSSSLLSAIGLCHLHIWGYWYFSWQSWFQLVLLPAHHSCMMYSAYKLTKQSDSIQPWCTPFPIWNQSVVPCLVLIAASWLAYRFLKRQVSWSGILISFKIFQFVVIHIVKGFGIVNKTEVHVFLELSYFFGAATDVGNLISGSSPFLNPAWTFGSS